MASVKKTIEVIFAGTDKMSGSIEGISGNLTNLGATVGDVTGSLRSFDAAVMSVAEPLASAADTVLKFDAALAALAIGGLTYAFFKSKEYESAIIDLEKVMGESEKVTADLESQFIQLSRTYGESTVEIVNALAGLRQSGYDTAEGMAVLETSLKLARASELSAEEATNLLKRAMIGYNLTAEDSIKIGDLWNQTSNVANTTVGKLAEGFAIVSRQALDAGFSMTELSAALTPMIGVFDSGSEAGIALSMTITRMLNPTKEAEEAIRALTGVTGPLNEEFETGKDIFEAVAVGLQEVDDKTGSVYVAQIAGAQQAKRIKVAFDDYSETLEKIGPVAEQYNSLQKEVDAQSASTQAAIDRLSVGFESLAITMGEQFREAAEEAIIGATEIENALEDMITSDTFKPIFDALSDFGNDVGDFLSAIAKTLPEAFELVDFSELLDALGELRESIGGMFDDFDPNDPKDLAEVIQFVIDTIESLITVTQGMIETFAPFIEGILNSVKAFNELSDADKKATGDVLAFAKALTELGSSLTAVIILIGDSAEEIGRVADAVVGAIGVTFGVFESGILTISIAILAALDSILAAAELVTFGSISDDFTEMRETLATEMVLLQEKLTESTGSVGESWDRMVSGITGNPIVPEVDTRKATEKITDLGASWEEFDRAFEDLEADIDLDVDAFERNLAIVEASLAESREISIGMDPDAWADIDDWSDELDAVLSDLSDIEVSPELESGRVGEIRAEIKDGVKTFSGVGVKVEEEVIEEAREKIRKGISGISAGEMTVGPVGITGGVTLADYGEATGLNTNALDNATGAIGNMSSLLEASADASGLERIAALDALSASNRLTDAIIRQINVQTGLAILQEQANSMMRSSMEAGDATIKIEATGVEPEIEAFMFKILKKIQVRANEAGAEFLLAAS